MKKMILLFALSAVWLINSTAQTADEILEKYFENSGGKENMQNIKTIKMLGIVPTPQGDFPLEIYHKAPNKIYAAVDVMGQKIVTQAYDGEIAWTLNPMTGNPNAQKLPEDQAKTLSEEAYLEGPFINYKEKGFTISYEGYDSINGKMCHLLELSRIGDQEKDTLVMNCYFDTETYFPVMISRVANSGQFAGQLVENYYDRYQDIGNGLIMSFEMNTKINGQSIQLLNFHTILVDEDIPDELFKYTGE